MGRFKYSSLAYAEKRRRGICVGNSCGKHATEGRLCKKHQKRQLRYQRTSQKRRYQRRKLEGLCTMTGCHERATGEHVKCATHVAQDAARRVRECADPAWNEKHRKELAAWYAKRKRLGLCRRCAAKRVGRSPFCEHHRQDRRDYLSKKLGREVLPREVLQARRRDAKKAEVRGPLPDAFVVPFEHYATARPA